MNLFLVKFIFTKVKLHDQYEGTKLCSTGFPHFSQIKTAFIESIQSALKKRFSEFSPSSTMQVFNASQIADLKAWPQEWHDLRGLLSVHVLVSTFKFELMVFVSSRFKFIMFTLIFIFSSNFACILCFLFHYFWKFY